jgi:hypothetical protein
MKADGAPLRPLSHRERARVRAPLSGKARCTPGFRATHPDWSRRTSPPSAGAAPHWEGGPHPLAPAPIRRGGTPAMAVRLGSAGPAPCGSDFGPEQTISAGAAVLGVLRHDGKGGHGLRASMHLQGSLSSMQTPARVRGTLAPEHRLSRPLVTAHAARRAQACAGRFVAHSCTASQGTDYASRRQWWAGRPRAVTPGALRSD